MSFLPRALAILIVLIVSNLIDCMPANAAVERSVAGSFSANGSFGPDKAYAVFVISYTDKAAIGGVAGTAFFVTPNKALTAYHVLQPISFHPQTGYTHSRIWLVHEHEPAIELHEADVKFDQNNDLTAITINQSVKTDYVYASNSASPLREVETEGFRANSIGPRLERVGDIIVITDVPTLDRIHLRGQIVQRSRIELHAIDVTLQETPCIQVSYEPIRGMSGGPLIAGGRVIGVNSFADPNSSERTWAVAYDSRTSALIPTINKSN